MRPFRTTCRLAGLCCVVIFSLAGHWSPAITLSQQAAAIDQASVGGVVTLGGPLKIGHATITLKPGATMRQISAAGQPCGLLIDGPAKLTYMVTDRFSIPVALRNVNHVGHLRTYGKRGAVVIWTNLEGAVIWGWEVGAGAPAAKAGAAPGAIPSWAKKILDRPLFSRPSLDLLAARGLDGHGTVDALLHGKRDDLVLSVDPVEERTEYLELVRRIVDPRSANVGYYGLEELAAQPIGRRWYERFPAPLVAVREAIAVDNDAGRHVRVHTVSTLTATRAGVGMWRVRLLDHVFDRGKRLPVAVTSVKVGGRPADFVRRDSQLLVKLAPPLARGARITVDVVNEGELAVRPGGDNFWSLGTMPWYPQPPLNGELATVDLSVRVPQPLIPFASGSELSETTQDGFTVLKTRLDEPSQVPVVAAGRYHVYSKTQDGITCRVASYVFGKKRACERLIKNFFAAESFYASLFDAPFPYKQVSVVEINTWGFGQAPPGIIFITKEAYEPLLDSFNQIFSAGVNERYVHEVAHSWWGHTLKMDSPEEQWLTESFAEYSAALFMEAAKGGGRKGAKEFRHLLDGWRSRTASIGDGGSIYLANHLAGDGIRDFRDRTFLLYAKGPLVLHAIRLELRKRAGSAKQGDRLFQVLLRSFLKNFTYRWGTTRDLIGILNQMTHSDWQPFFDRYVYGTETPKI